MSQWPLEFTDWEVMGSRVLFPCLTLLRFYFFLMYQMCWVRLGLGFFPIPVCVYMCLWVYTRGERMQTLWQAYVDLSVSSSITFHLVFWNRVSCWTWSLSVWLDWPFGQQWLPDQGRPWVPLGSASQHQDHRCTQLHLVFHMDARIQPCAFYSK